ncbi:MAG: hypothetical protein JWR18_2902 [Segetibacter sp.]|jgi:hypothetical protein|nr:hypothetical protein [Segetibacter sp.]
MTKRLGHKIKLLYEKNDDQISGYLFPVQPVFL